MKHILLSRGEKYPLTYQKSEGATADFLRESGNRLLIVTHGISGTEEQAFRYGMITGSFLYKDGALLWLFRFYRKDGQPAFTFDAPFDARLIPADDRQLYNIENQEQRILIELHVVDERGILRALRAITMPPKLTLDFLLAVQEQLSSSAGASQLASWMQSQPEELAKTIKLEVLGK